MPGHWSEHRPPDGPFPEWRMPRSFTLWAPVIVSFLVQVPAALVVSRVTRDMPLESLLSVGLALAGPVLLIGARRFPGPVVALIALVATLDLFVGHNLGPPYLALAFAIIGAIVRGARIWAWVAIGGCWIAAITIAAIMGTDTWAPGRIAGTTLGILIVLGLGEAFRTRHERGEEFRRRLSQRRETAVQAERVRIARELHDVLAHSLSQINVQAGVGLHLMPTQPDKAADALASIKETSKSALDEVRAVLGVLRSDPSEPAPPLVPEPDLDRVAALVESFAASGMQVTLDDRLVHTEVSAPVQH
ncbi:MAG TPA: histidine kinase dimerization/phosphoacceptor domain-containing protein, partial [Pseudolysinimonas sp.]|nr:histidine kinase dimerization/phosphoacceptor domain-containing protein [Pseudolysinimonas sp.]